MLQKKKEKIKKIFGKLKGKDKILLFKQLAFEYEPKRNLHQTQYAQDIYSFLINNKAKFFDHENNLNTAVKNYFQY